MKIFGVMFHHFHDGETYIKGQGSIDTESFQQLLLALQKNYQILSPVDYCEKVLQNRLAPNEICLTFDDALKCQIDIALPVLQELKLSAFFFVYSEALYGPPDQLEVFRDFRHRKFASMDIFYTAFFTNFEMTFPQKFSQYQQEYPVNYLKEFPFYTEMDRRFRYVRDNSLDSNEYETLMFQLMKTYNYSAEKHASNLFMTRVDLQRLCSTGNAIGLHSNSHPTTMDKHSSSDQWAEYNNNKVYLEKCTGQEIWSMSHPCGRYNNETLEILHDLNIKIGFRSSLAMREIKSPLEIPREDHSNLVKALL